MEITVRDGQSLYDIALQYYGDIAGFWWLLEDNGLTVESEIQSGDLLEVRDAFIANSALYFRQTSREINNSDEADPVVTPLSVSVIGIKNELNGGDGAVRISVIGGSLPYAYLWSNGSTSRHLTSVSSGSYTLIVEDARGAQATLSVYVSATDKSEYLTDHERVLILARSGNGIQIQTKK